MTELDLIYVCPVCGEQVHEFIWLYYGKYYCSLEHALRGMPKPR